MGIIKYTIIKSAWAVIGFYHHRKFERNIFKTVDTRLLTDKQTNETDYILFTYKPFGRETKRKQFLLKEFTRLHVDI